MVKKGFISVKINMQNSIFGIFPANYPIVLDEER